MATGIIGLVREQLATTSLYMNLKEEVGQNRNIQIDLNILQRLFDEFDKEGTKIIVLTDSNCRSAR